MCKQCILAGAIVAVVVVVMILVFSGQQQAGKPLLNNAQANRSPGNAGVAVCGDGACGAGETAQSCPADCAPCTDSDGGNYTATWGVATGMDPVTASQVTTGDYCALADEFGNIQAVDTCSNSANTNCKLFEMNCEPVGPNMAPAIVVCPSGCDRGICV